MNLIELANYYIENHNLETSPEAIFIEFEFIMRCHTEFEKHLKQNGLNEKLEKMKRNKRLLSKRKLFVQWYLQKFQNKKLLKEIHIDLSEMIFASERTVREDILS